MARLISEGMPCNVKVRFSVSKKSDVTKLVRVEKILNELGMNLQVIVADGTDGKQRSWFLTNEGYPYKVFFAGKN